MCFRMIMAVCAVASLLIIGSANAAVPGAINLQGVLTDSSGNPMPNTGYGVTFRIYTAAAGGTVLWTEETAVYTLNGLFTVVLGTQTPVPDTAFNNPDRWLGIQMDDYPEMTPRTRIATVAYAFRLATVDGASGGSITGKVSVGPGHSNTGGFAFVAGESNTASGYTSTIAGGNNNEVSGYSSTIAGGYNNGASGLEAAIGGGASNVASGDWSTIPGGLLNTATGIASFACGRSANASSNYSFVWSDGTAPTAAADNNFVARASGGFTLLSSSGSTGAYLFAGSGGWSPISDSTVKDNRSSVNAQKVLEQLASLPIETWNYETQDPNIRHIGPMAQDFRAAFGFGESARHISTIDADGIALAAIQALYGRNQELEATVADLKSRLERLEAK